MPSSSASCAIDSAFLLKENSPSARGNSPEMDQKGNQERIKEGRKIQNQPHPLLPERIRVWCWFKGLKRDVLLFRIVYHP
jgi:hypothetical protein